MATDHLHGITTADPIEQAESRPRPRLHRPGFIRELVNSLFFIIAALIIAEMALPRSSVNGPSMEPTLWTGQHLLISRLHYLFGEPQRGDVIVFDPPNSRHGQEMLIKRLIGLPGDTVEFREQQLYLNGELLAEPYFINTPCEPRSCPDRVWELGPNDYFAMGDNRNRSNDSRSFGALPREYIVGRAVFRYWPVDEIGTIQTFR
jgi:signal peptidase I